MVIPSRRFRDIVLRTAVKRLGAAASRLRPFLPLKEKKNNKLRAIGIPCTTECRRTAAQYTRDR